MKELVWFRVLSCWLLAIVFLLASFSKISDLSAFHQTVKQLNWLPLLGQGLTVLVLPGLELILGFSLLTGWARREGLAVVLLLLTFFLIMSVVVQLGGASSTVGCGCIKIHMLQWFEFKGWWLVVRNIVLLGLAVGTGLLEWQKRPPDKYP
jgi:Methylamine utilisation protein MauE